MNKPSHLLITDRQKIRDHWNKSDQQLKMEIDMVREWLNSQKHLPEIPSDVMIEYTLTNCKFSIEKAKRVLDMYYTIRSLMPDIYENKHPKLQHMKTVFEAVYICTIPKLTEGLHRISLVKFKDREADLFQLEDYLAQVLRNTFEIKLTEDLNLGDIFIFDCQFFKVGHVIKVSPMLLKKGAFIFEKLWCNRLKGIHFVNCASYMDIVITLLKSVVPAKLKARVYVHDNIEDLCKFVPQELLPTDYGGKQKSMDELLEWWKLKLEEYYPRFDKLEELKVNETLRPEKLVNSDILGYHGNFKKIDID